MTDGVVKAKLRSRQGAFRVEFEGENGEVGSIWLSYLASSATMVVRVQGQHGDGRIEVEDMTD